MPPRRENLRAGAKRGRPPKRGRPAARVVGADEASVPPVGVSINQPDTASSVQGSSGSGLQGVPAPVNPVEPNPAVQLNQPQVPVGAPPPIERNVELQSKMFDRFLKRNPPRFSEAESPIQALEFIKDLEAIFEPMAIEGELRWKFAVYQFHGEARDWWGNIYPTLTTGGQGPLTWERFVKIFTENYCLSTHMLALERELLQLNQDTVTEYAKRFNELCRLLPDVYIGEQRKIQRFRDGMELDIRSRLSLMTFSSVNELKNAALQVEKEQVEFRDRSENSRGNQGVSRNSGQRNYGIQEGHPIQPSRFTQSQSRAPVAHSQFSSAGSVQRPTDTARVGESEGTFRGRRESGRCFRCGSVYHKVQNCPERGVTCFRCHQLGHIATHCPQTQGAGSSSNTFRPVQSVRGGFQGGRGGQFGGRGNQGRGAGNSQDNESAGRGRIFTVTQDETQQLPKAVTGTRSYLGRS